MNHKYYIGNDISNIENCIYVGEVKEAGYYCFNCQETLCFDISQLFEDGLYWNETCCSCERYIDVAWFEDDLEYYVYMKQEGIKPTIAFIWGMERYSVLNIIRIDKLDKDKCIIDNQNNILSLDYFLKITQSCPIQFI